MRYRKKPVVVEAVQWFKNGDSAHVFPYYAFHMVVMTSPGSTCEQCGMTYGAHGWIDTLEQGHRVCPGDWIVTGIKGEFYPCKDEIFRMTYEAVTDAS